jgi:tetratricopeptide (TPR) repeat protein
VIQQAQVEHGSPDALLGREVELTALLSGLDQARAGQGVLFLVGGEPGIGKSRLADEFAAHAREAGARVLWGRCWEGVGAPPYWPWIQAIRAHLRNVDPSVAREQLGTAAADMAQMLPEIRALVPDLPPPPPDSDAARFQLFDSTATFLRNVARAGETVLVLDDLHAADQPSLLLLRFLAGQLSDMGMVVIATYRDVELSPEHPLTAAVGELARQSVTRPITLKGLREEVIGPFLESAAGITPSARLVRDMWRETAGNPLFMGEAVRLLAGEGNLDAIAAGSSLRLVVPPGVREVIGRRLSQLSEASVQALEAGAALGPEFGVEIVRRVGAYSADSLADLLQEAIDAGLLVPVTGSVGRLRFSHDVVREVLYQKLAPVRRISLHRRIAETLEQVHSTSPEDHLAELAHHFSRAAEVSSTDAADPASRRLIDKARAYAMRAGEVAVRSLAYEEAARLFALALELASPDQLGDERERAELLLAIGDADARAGDLLASRQTFREAGELARRIGNASQLARAALGYGGRFLWARAGNDTHLVPLLQDALVILGGADDRLRVRLLTRLACAWRDSPAHRDHSNALSEQAVALARTLDDPSTLVYALIGRFWATWWPENIEERFELAKTIVAVGEAAGDAERMFDAHHVLYGSLAELGRMPEARREIQRAKRVADALRQPAQLWLGPASDTLLALMEGDYTRASKALEEEGRSYPATPIRDDISAVRMHRFLLYRELGLLDQLEGSVRASAEEFPWYPYHQAALACLLCELGRKEDAWAVYNELASDDFSRLYHDCEWLLGISLASEAGAMLGDARGAEALYRQLLPYAGRHALGQSDGSAGAVDRYLGLLAQAMGRLDDAEQHLSDAIELNERMGARPWAAHSQADLARVLRQRNGGGDIARAAELERSAGATADQLGMTALANHLRQLVASATPAVEMAGPEMGSAGTIRREGDYWTIAFGDDTFRLRDAKGLRYLARLLAEPGREFLALDLVGDAAARPVGRPMGTDGLNQGGFNGTGPELDAEAKSAYRRRVRDLQEELTEAESWNDAPRADRAREEMDFVARELARAVGLGGRDRTVGSPIERARLSVTRAIRQAMARIAQNSPSLGEHLETAIHTGTYCVYRPDSRLALTWLR